tara:strand:- start:1737 stop:2888 length:1152 start_codon:yes stop_codon:yes gene_type:complete
MKIFSKFILLILFILIINFDKAYSSNQIKIGLMVPLTGEFKEVGKSILNATKLAVNKINNNKILIVPKDTKANPEITLKVAKELSDSGIQIVIGPIFNKNLTYLDELDKIIFLSLSNKVLKIPSNVISAGINAESQVNTIKKFQKEFNIERTIFLIPQTDYKPEIENAIKKTKIKLKEKFVYDTDPTKLTSQIENLTRYSQRKQNLLDEIKRVENSDDLNKEKKIDNLKKKDTLGGINFDSVIIADFDESLKSVATSLLYTDISAKRISYIGLNQWFDISLIKEKSLHPFYFPSINKKNYEEFTKEYSNIFGEEPTQISFLSYDLVGLVYFLIYKNNFIVDEKIFYKKNKFKGKVGIFEINKNKINHILNLYSAEGEDFKKIF